MAARLTKSTNETNVQLGCLAALFYNFLFPLYLIDATLLSCNCLSDPSCLI
jgi:hypothetical protein